MATRRTLLGSSMAALAGTMATTGVAAAGVASMPTLNGADGRLLSLRAELTAAVADLSYWNTLDDDDSDDDLTRSNRRLTDVCLAIAAAPPAQTDAGRALKAAACMHQLRYNYGFAGWDGDGAAISWAVLKELAGNAYVPVAVPDYARDTVPEAA